MSYGITGMKHESNKKKKESCVEREITQKFKYWQNNGKNVRMKHGINNIKQN